ncbi:MAG: hypothetical protein ABSG78_05435 [Verrucomicrobiota bacterium]
MDTSAHIQDSPPPPDGVPPPLGRPGVECKFAEVQGHRGRRPLAPPAVSRSPILYLMSLRWAAGRRPRPEKAKES